MLKCRISSWDLQYLSLKSDAQKQMIEYDFYRKFHDLNYFKVGFKKNHILKFVVYLRA